MALSDETLEQFLEELASSAPAPGGGAAAALAGAMAAGLVAMVCRLTIGRKNYAEASAELEKILPQAEEKRRTLMELMEADAAAYAEVIAAYRRPKDTEADRAARDVAIQQALKQAAEVPFQIVGACADILDLTLPVAAKGNKNAVSDAGSAVLLADAGLRAAQFNVIINLGLIQDAAYVAGLRARLEPFIRGRDDQVESMLRTVEARL